MTTARRRALRTGLTDFNNQAYASAKCIGALYIVRDVT